MFRKVLRIFQDDPRLAWYRLALTKIALTRSQAPCDQAGWRDILAALQGRDRFEFQSSPMGAVLTFFRYPVHRPVPARAGVTSGAWCREERWTSNRPWVADEIDSRKSSIHE